MRTTAQRRVIRVFNYKKACFMVYVLAMLAFVITNAIAKFTYLYNMGVLK